MFFKIFSVLFFFLLFTSHIVSQDFSDEWRASECKFEPLPSDLSKPGYLFTGTKDLHFHGEFFANFSELEKSISFQLHEKSLIRIYLAPHEADLDIYLKKHTAEGAEIVASSIGFSTEETIFATIDEGEYEILLRFFGVIIGDYDASECDTLTMELAITSRALMEQRATALQCPPSSQIPKISFDSLAENHQLSYNSDKNEGVIFNTQTKATNEAKINWIANYTFSLPEGRNSIWNFNAVLGFDFLTGGSLGLLLEIVDPNHPNTPSLDCTRDGNCTVGFNQRRNELVISKTLPPCTENCHTYRLWIYEHLNEKDDTLMNCTPFSLQLEINGDSKEPSYLDCQVLNLPKVLEPNAWNQQKGYFHYEGEFLVENKISNSVFTIEQKSYFRASVEFEGFTLLSLYDANNQSIAVSFYWGQQEQSLVAFLDPGSYRIAIDVFGLSASTSCSSYQLEIAIVSQSHYSSINYCPSKSSFPDLSNINETLESNGKFVSTQTGPFYFLYDGEYSYKKILSQSFVVSKQSLFSLNLGYDFVFDNVYFILENVFENATIETKSERGLNHRFLRSILEPGTYRLTISSGGESGKRNNHFPFCAKYSFGLEILSNEGQNECWNYPRLPKNLNLPQYLGNNGIVHFAEEYIVPPDAEEEMTLSVATKSLFRVWTEPNFHIDLDFYLYESGNDIPLAYTIKPEQNEEELLYQLDANKDYRLVVKYYPVFFPDPHHPVPRCKLFKFELAVSPVTENTSPCDTVLPSPDLIPSTSQNSSFFVQEKYSFVQSEKPLSIKLPFVVENDFIYFRATILYDFLWTDVSMKIIINNQTQVWAENFYGYKDISSQLLSPGYYTLEIYEPLGMKLDQYRSCAEFQLTIAYKAVSDMIDEKKNCKSALLPPSLNSIAFLSPLSGNKVHFQRNILVDTKNRKDTTTFTIDKSSLFSIFVPKHPRIDVDLRLEDSEGNTLVSKTGFDEEGILYYLNNQDSKPKTYILTTRYYGFHGSSLPSSSECVYFPAEIALSPVSEFENQFADCGQYEIPWDTLSIELNKVFETTGCFKADGTFKKEFSFSLDKSAIFDFDLRYPFLPAGLSIVLKGQVDNEHAVPINKTFYNQIGYNHAFIHEILPKGQYELVIHDPFDKDHRTPNIDYSILHLNYLINSTGDISVPCGHTDSLPTDLYSSVGGSQPFGGPQDEHGNIQLFGESFLLNDESGKDNFILFKVKEKSFMRIYSAIPEGSDIDFWLYNNASRPAGSLIETALGTDVVESALWKLDSQQNDYLLNIFFWKVNSEEEECPTFSLELAIKTASLIEQELRCPVEIPTSHLPPQEIECSSPIEMYKDALFTNEDIEGNMQDNIFTYRITLHIVTNTTLVTQIGYNFLANEFSLNLKDSNGNVLQKGVSGPSENRDSYINFFNSLEYNVIDPQDLYLEIVEDLSKKDFELSEYCHTFKFNFVAIPQNTQEKSTIEFILPAEGHDLNPNEDLIITIYFSKPVSIDSNQDILEKIRQDQSVKLLDTESGHSHQPFFPSRALFDTTRRQLEVTFSKDNFKVKKSYRLILDANKFKDESGNTFSMADDSISFIYSMRDCSCPTSHGFCNENTGLCVCQPAYTGDTCEKCAPNYHAAGSECVPNQPCEEFTCHGHGTCHDDKGYPQCVCDEGYATTGSTFCSICAQGYSGYPNCTAEEEEPSSQCNALLLPDSLDSIEYLGFNGEVHLQDDYFIDLDHSKHEIRFTLEKDSLIRVYAEPHWVDIDLWLYEYDEVKDKYKVIEFGISIGDEEIIFTPLYISGAHREYLLRLKYYVWDSEHEIDCETFNLELAITPIERVEEISSKYQCPKDTHKLPSLDFTEISSKMNVYQNNLAIRAHPHPTNGPHFLYHHSFEIKCPKDKLAMLHAEIGYQFLIGDLVLVLESGEQLNCNSSLDSSKCLLGSNTLNRNSVDKILSSGIYSIWIYEPEPQNGTFSECAPFDFTFNVDFVDATEDNFYCDGKMFPKTFNSPGYLDEVGHVHVQDDFLLLEDVEIHFTLQDDSVFRMNGKADFPVSFVITDNQGNTMSSDEFSYTPELFISGLERGSYKLQIAAFFFTGDRCPKISTELDIAPFQKPLFAQCPSSEVLPDISDISVPFKFPPSGESPTFYARTNNPVIREYQFTIEETVFFEAVLTSDFLTSALRLQLQFEENGSIGNIYGTHRYSENFLRKTLQRGHYTLKLILPSADKPRPHFFPECAEFKFALTITPINDADKCLFYGESLPTSFNQIRYLGLDRDFDFQSHAIRVPSFDGFPSHKISFSVDVPSLFRVYTEPHRIDIDLILYAQDLDGNYNVIADGGYGFNNEESIALLLEKDKQYQLELIFWKWESDLPDCLYFNLEVGISPIHSEPEKCINSGSDHWPPSPKPSTIGSDGYHYSSVETKEELFFQQSSQQAKNSDPISFTLTDDAPLYNLYSFVSYDFILSDLVMTLENTDTQEKFYGKNTLNGNELQLIGLSPGHYKLVLHEPVVGVKEYLSCSFFTFDLHIVPDSKETLIPSDPFLPTTLDRIPFLLSDHSIYLEDFFQMFDDNTNEEITFTIKEASLFRVSTTHYLRDVDTVQIVLRKDNELYYVREEAMLLNLPKGSYKVTFNRPLKAQNFDQLRTNIQIAISPISRVQENLKPFEKDCKDSTIENIVPNSKTGYYHFNGVLSSSKETISQKEKILSVGPFTVKRPSSVFVRVGYQYLESDLEAEIQNENQHLSIVGTNARNLNEINDLLEPGNYLLNIKQPAVFNLTSLLPHCTKYTLHIILQDKHEHNHVDCSKYNVLPWNLSSPTGGSEPYGGPIDNAGNLHLAGDKFLMPPSGSKSSISMQIYSGSILSVVSREDYFGEITFTLTRGTNIKMITSPLAYQTLPYQRAELFSLEHTGTGHIQPTEYEIEFTFNTPSWETCPIYNLQMVMQPLGEIQRNVICPQKDFSPVLPKTHITPKQGLYSENITSFWTNTVLAQYTPQNEFAYNITIDTPPGQTWLLSANLGFNSLVNLFTLEILNSHGIRIATGEYETQTMHSGNTNLNQVLSGLLEANTTYTLTIRQPRINLPFSEGLIPLTQCYPFVWDIQLLPAVGTPYVINVQPSGASNLSPKDAIELELTFSTEIYSGLQKITEDDPEPLINAVYLSEINGQRNIPTDRVELTGRTSWKFVFAPKTPLATKSVYQLKITPNALKDKTGKNVEYLKTNKYSIIDTSCNGNGKFEYEFCNCNTGYAGITCETCDIKYKNTNLDPSKPVKCEQVISDKCLKSSCGCDPRYPKDCVPLGKCDDSSGEPVCHCNGHLVGEKCGSCEDGYEKWPLCVPKKTSPPVTSAPSPKPHNGGKEKSGNQASHSNGARIAGIVLSCVVLLVTIVIFAYKKFKKPSGYGGLELGLQFEDED